MAFSPASNRSGVATGFRIAGRSVISIKKSTGKISKLEDNN
jgi:hypothetical protein